MRNATAILLQEINEGARHWHDQMSALGSGDLNGSFGRVLADAENTEEELDKLWLELRRTRAAMQIPWFKDTDEVFACRESVFDAMLHIAPVN
jgi:hypothetical protein